MKQDPADAEAARGPADATARSGLSKHGRLDIGPGLRPGHVLWRYIDAARFLDLLHRRRMFLSRADQLEDPYEGALERAQRHTEAGRSRELKRRLRERTFLGCWHAGADDSFAMWRLHGHSECSVAVKTTVARLVDVVKAAQLPHAVALRRVEYVSSWDLPPPARGSEANIFAYKLRAYAFEKEVRIIVSPEPHAADEKSCGLALPVELDRLVRSVVVAPNSPDWFVELTAGVVRRYGLRAPVRRSRLAIDPL